LTSVLYQNMPVCQDSCKGNLPTLYGHSELSCIWPGAPAG